MQPIARRSEVQALDEHLAREGLVESTIERVGYAVALEARRWLGGVYGRRVAVVEGTGNNGRDGRAAGRWLERWGARVRTVPLRSLRSGDDGATIAASDLVIDAALGTGSTRALEPLGLERAPRVLAVDVPSGLDADTGAVVEVDLGGAAVVAGRTATVGAIKPGLLMGEGPEHAGTLVRVVADLVPAAVSTWLVEEADVVAGLPVPRRDTHKWRSGLLVIAGSSGMRGAAAFVALGASAVGAGIVHVATRGEPLDAVALEVAPEAVVVRLATGRIDAVLAGAHRFGAAVIGPGLGDGLATANLVRRAVLSLEIPLVLDADGLNALAGNGRLASVLAGRRAPVVVTPHEGELRRLMPELVGDPLSRAGEAARTLNVVVVLKGNPTVVAAPGGERFVVANGTARLATAGTGDVLAGIIGGLLAVGLDPLRAAWTGAWIHAHGAAASSRRCVRPVELADHVAAFVGTATRVASNPGAAVEVRP